MLLALGVPVAVVLLLLFLFRRPWRHRIFGDKFPGPRAYPVFGNALQIGTTTADLYEYVLRNYKKFYGTSYRVWLGNRLGIFLTTSKDIEILLSSPTQLRKSSMYDYFLNWLSDCIVTSTGPQWKQTRKFLHSVFTKRCLKDYVETFVHNSEIMVDKLEEKAGGPPINIHHYSSLNATDNMCETLMGMRINAQTDLDSEFVKAVHEECAVIVERAFKPWYQPDFIFNLTKLKNKEDKALKVLHGTVNEAIRRRRPVIEREMTLGKGTAEPTDEGNHVKASYVDALLRSTFKGSNMSDISLRGEVGTMTFAGQDTISICVALTLWHLAWNQSIQDRVVEEILQVCPDPDEKLTYYKIQELKYLDMVLKENLRMHPSLPVIGRNVDEDTHFSDGTVAPKGSDVIVGIYLVHMDPKFYPEPEKFDPDRFLPENTKDRPVHAYVPFSLGPRHCPGANFAMVEMKCTISKVLRRYRVLPGSEKQKLQQSLEPILIVEGGVPVKLEFRN